MSARRLLRRPEVEARVGLRVSAIYEKMSKGLFPRPVKLGERAVGWPETEIDAWVEERLAERDRSSARAGPSQDAVDYLSKRRLRRWCWSRSTPFRKGAAMPKRYMSPEATAYYMSPRPSAARIISSFEKQVDKAGINIKSAEMPLYLHYLMLGLCKKMSRSLDLWNREPGPATLMISNAMADYRDALESER